MLDFCLWGVRVCNMIVAWTTRILSFLGKKVAKRIVKFRIWRDHRNHAMQLLILHMSNQMGELTYRVSGWLVAAWDPAAGSCVLSDSLFPILCSFSNYRDWEFKEFFFCLLLYSSTFHITGVLCWYNWTLQVFGCCMSVWFLYFPAAFSNNNTKLFLLTYSLM